MGVPTGNKRGMGAFGAIFTAIAVAHTLYAPREVVIWNWRRIVLLGVSLALAVGSQFSLIVIVPVALGFMLYLAPERRTAALVIWLVGCALGILLIYVSYDFRAAALWQGLRHATLVNISSRAFTISGNYVRLARHLAECGPALMLGLVPALITYAAWHRSRYFGNTAPLMIAALFLLLSLASPHYPGLGFLLMATPFLMLFVAGISADLLEGSNRSIVLTCLWTLLTANALWTCSNSRKSDTAEDLRGGTFPYCPTQ